MSALELRDVSKVYGEGANEVHALRGVDLSVEAGALVAVMGPSGSGKSTLLTIAGSLEVPSGGEVADRRRHGVGDVAQRPGPFAAPVDRLRVPGLQSAGRPERVGERLLADGARRHRRAQGARRRDGKHSRSSGSPTARRAFPTSSPVENDNASRSRARSWGIGTCCWRTSRRVHSIPRMPRR